MSVLSNPSFLGFIALLTLVFTIVPCLFALYNAWQKRKKHSKWLVLRNVTSIQLINDNIGKFRTVSITYKDENRRFETLNTTAVLKGEIVNMGEQDVLKEDFQSTLNLHLTGGSKWLEVLSPRQSNKASNASLTICERDSAINISFDILKPGDSIEFESLISIASSRLENVFDDIDIQNGIKDTFVEKQRSNLRKRDFSFDPVAYALLSFVAMMFCTLIAFSLAKVFLDQNTQRKTQGKQVLFLSSNGLKYSASYDGNLVFLKQVNAQDVDASEERALFQKEFELQYKPVLEESTQPIPQKQEEPFVLLAFLYLIGGVYLLVYAISTIVFIVSLLCIFVDFLGKTFSYTFK